MGLGFGELVLSRPSHSGMPGPDRLEQELGWNVILQF